MQNARTREALADAEARLMQVSAGQLDVAKLSAPARGALLEDLVTRGDVASLLTNGGISPMAAETLLALAGPAARAVEASTEAADLASEVDQLRAALRAAKSAQEEHAQEAVELRQELAELQRSRDGLEAACACV